MNDRTRGGFIVAALTGFCGQAMFGKSFLKPTRFVTRMKVRRKPRKQYRGHRATPAQRYHRVGSR